MYVKLRKFTTHGRKKHCRVCNWQKWSGRKCPLTFASDLRLTRNGKDGILPVVDKESKMVHLIPCIKDITATGSTDLICKNIEDLHSIPRIIYSDPEMPFTSQCWRDLWGLPVARLRSSSSYHSQIQGAVETMNSIVSRVLRRMIGETNRKKDWKQLLTTVEITTTSSPNCRTGHAPSFWNSGFHAMPLVGSLSGYDSFKIEPV